MGASRQQPIDSGSIFRYFYALVGTVLLLLVITALFLLWRLDRVAGQYQVLSQYHQATTIKLDTLITELNFLEVHAEQHRESHPQHPHDEVSKAAELDDHLFTIEKLIERILDTEHKYQSLEFAGTIQRLQQRYSLFHRTLQKPAPQLEVLEQWQSIGTPLVETAHQLHRLHERASLRMSTELEHVHRRNLTVGLGLAVGLVMLGVVVTLQVKKKIARLIGMQLASEGKFRTVLESAPDAMIIVDQEGQIALANENTERIFGYTRQELMGAPARLLVPESLQASRSDAFDEQLNRPQPVSMGEKHEFLAVRKDGSEFQADISIGMLKSGDDLLLVCALRDISSRKRVEVAMEYLARSGSSRSAANAFFNECVQSLATAYGASFVFIGMLQGEREDSVRTVSVCKSGKLVDNFQYNLRDSPCEQVMKDRKQMFPEGTLTRYPKDEVLQRMGLDAYFGAPLISTDGKRYGLVVVSHTAPLVLDHWAELLLDVYALRIANELERRESESELHRYQEHLEELVRDRTQELERSNQELRSALKELESFSYSVSHDLRSPLRALDGYSHFLMEDYGPQLDSTAQGYLERIRSGSQRMGALIDGLLSLTRIKTQTLRLEPLDMSAMVHEIARILSDRDPSRQVQWVIEDGVSCRADAGLMPVLLQNLLENAWKYTSENTETRIEFGVSRNKNEPVFFVADNGVGFDMRYEDKLFKAFHRLHGDDSGFTGMGIGLATVHRIIEQHGGKIWAEGRVGEGARFSFTLGPAAA